MTCQSALSAVETAYYRPCTITLMPAAAAAQPALPTIESQNYFSCSLMPIPAVATPPSESVHHSDSTKTLFVIPLTISSYHQA